MEAHDYGLINNTEENQYEFHIDKYIPKIEYIKTANNNIFLTHTEVPTALEGQGVGTSLVKKALEDVEKQALVPLCPFVAGYIRKHPEWKRILKKGINV